ncbi:MAG: hypothetical protein N2380_09990 [bacterium]|nr:hypothetical protein [bacterium]
MTDKKFYRVISRMDGFPYGGRYFDDIEIVWFYSERREFPLVKYEEIIEDYNEKKKRNSTEKLESYIDEFFALHEATRLKKFLDQHFKDIVTEIREVDSIPTDPDVTPLKEVPIGGGIDFYLLWKEDKYPLSFKVEGIFDIRPVWRKTTQKRWRIELALSDLDLYELPSLTVADRSVYILDAGKVGGDFLVVSRDEEVEKFLREKGFELEEISGKIYKLSFKNNDKPQI